jgi:hypothetical protein
MVNVYYLFGISWDDERLQLVKLQLFLETTYIHYSIDIIFFLQYIRAQLIKLQIMCENCFVLTEVLCAWVGYMMAE